MLNKGQNEASLKSMVVLHIARMYYIQNTQAGSRKSFFGFHIQAFSVNVFCERLCFTRAQSCCSRNSSFKNLSQWGQSFSSIAWLFSFPLPLQFSFYKREVRKMFFFYIFLYVLRIKILLFNEGLKKGHE